jgi:glycosyltransferase involved in cell wall biosynthesis
VKVSLLILAYNEESYIEEVVNKYKNYFESLIIVNDFSTDKTGSILDDLTIKNDNIVLINNKKNVGPGKSMFNGVEYFLESDGDYLIKIDGDDQFLEKDVVFLLDKIKKEHFDFIKCDRFWIDGIVGKIPNIRYFGNAFASFLIKFTTGNWLINDPLNGLFVFSKYSLEIIQLPKLFYRYGYPFFIISEIAKNSIVNEIKIGQYKNRVKYEKEESNLNAFIMFFKLTWFALKNYYSKIKFKMKISELQLSGILDIFSQVFLLISLWALIKSISIRYFTASGPQGTLFVLFLFMFSICTILIVFSQKIESAFSRGKFSKLN